MKFLADLHIHSHLSRATSKDLTLEHLHGWAQRKGICEDGLLPLRFPGRPAADLEEERRLLYVGMTRAKSRLVLTRAQQRPLSGTALARAPSPFLEGLPGALVRASVQPARRRRAEQLTLL